MKKLLSILVLSFLFSGSAYSEWIELSESDNGTLYYDPNTLIKNEKTLFIWSLIDQKKNLQQGKSRKVHLEINCLNRKFKMHFLVIYKDQLGQGDIISSLSIADNSDWTSAIPGSTLYPLIKKTCN